MAWWNVLQSFLANNRIKSSSYETNKQKLNAVTDNHKLTLYSKLKPVKDFRHCTIMLLNLTGLTIENLALSPESNVNMNCNVMTSLCWTGQCRGWPVDHLYSAQHCTARWFTSPAEFYEYWMHSVATTRTTMNERILLDQWCMAVSIIIVSTTIPHHCSQWRHVEKEYCTTARKSSMRLLIIFNLNHSTANNRYRKKNKRLSITNKRNNAHTDERKSIKVNKV